ncbi:helix-turn-helix domain-containing protein [Lysobacter sp. CA199]|uniref:helix-turn-helix domain-containing protein n=1 Tax=Lysobacter sp. CA199 TaxID=3455608 RepID=UPI003F8D68A6
MSIPTLSTEELANRWRVAPRTIRRWREEGIGPISFKIARMVRYRLDDIEGFERRPNRAESSAAPSATGAA